MNTLPPYQSYNSDNFAPIRRAEDQHFWFRARNKIINGVMNHLLTNLSEPLLIGEIGCGNGNTLQVLEQVILTSAKKHHLIGMDLFYEGLQNASDRTTCTLIQADVHHAPFGKRFDVICLFDVLEHLHDDITVLSDIHNLLKPDGYLVFTVPAHMHLWSYFDEFSNHCRRYSKHEVVEKLRGADYRVEFVSYFMMTLYPLMRITRLYSTMIKRINNANNNFGNSTRDLALRELKVLPIVNNVLYSILSSESYQITNYRQLPFGTSILAVARRSL